MRTRLLLPALLGVELVLGGWQAPVRAASDSDKRMVAIVAARIFAEAEPVQGWAWPPLVAISEVDGVNAFATICEVKPGERPEVTDEFNKPMKYEWIEVPTENIQGGDLGADDITPADVSAGAADATVVVPNDEPQAHRVDEHGDGTITQPVIILHQGFLDDIVQGSADRLAAVFGHETSHILLRHVGNVAPGGLLVANMVTRHQEADADMLGMKLGLAADFPYKGLVGGALAMRENGNYSSFEGLNATHPSWTDRVATYDSRQSELWGSISAFENGVYFLTAEQYELAESCFEQVTKECPKCYEAWANLGYARLMMYCDKFDLDDMRDLDVGLLIVGGFYRRPDSITRGFDKPLWDAAVEALKQALTLNPDLVLVKANLAVAYLVSPDGKDVAGAEEMFRQVREALKSGAVEDMDTMVRAALLANAGVAEMETGDPVAAEALFAEAEEWYGRGVEEIRAREEARGPTQAADLTLEKAQAGGNALTSALHYNRSRMYLAASDESKRKSAVQELEAYLSSASPAQLWWPLAYEQYRKLCADQGVTAKGEEDLMIAANKRLRLVPGVTLPTGERIILRAPTSEALPALDAVLGEGSSRDIVKKTNIRRVTYAKAGIELVCDDEIVAIRLRGAKSPSVTLRETGPGGQTSEIRAGMTVDELDAALGGEAKTWDRRHGTTQQIVYHYYDNLGIGVRIAGDKVSEIIVAQIPYEAKVE
jgi:Zn-dependent protease with chaperone function